MGPEELGVEQLVAGFVAWLRLAVELTGVLIITVGVLAALRCLVRRNDSKRFNHVRLTLAGYLALALEFQLAADILSTAVAPSWEKIGKLAAIAIIRTALNFFLMKEIAHEERAENPGPP